MIKVLLAVASLLQADDQIEAWEAEADKAREDVTRDELMLAAIRLNFWSKRVMENDIEEEVAGEN